MNKSKITSEALPEQFDEETLTILSLAKLRNEIKNYFASEHDIEKRSSDKGISFYQAKKELINESRCEREKIMNAAMKLRSSKLSKEDKKKLGIKTAGRPKGSKSLNTKYSKSELDSKLSAFIRAYYEREGNKPTQEITARALGLKYAKKLQRLLDHFDEKRDWPSLVEEMLGEPE